MNPISAFKPLSKDDLAAVLGVSIRTIENWVSDGILLAPTRLGNRVYWHPDTFYGWLDRRLSGDAATVAPETATVPECASATLQPARAGSRARGAKSQLDKVRSRTQAQLDALMG